MSYTGSEIICLYLEEHKGSKRILDIMENESQCEDISAYILKRHDFTYYFSVVVFYTPFGIKFDRLLRSR